MKDSIKRYIEDLKHIIKYNLKKWTKAVQEFMFSNIYEDDNANIAPVKKCRTTVISCIVLIFLAINMIVFKDKTGMDSSLAVSLLIISIFGIIFGVISGSLFMEKYRNGEYLSTKGIVINIQKNILLGISNVTLLTDDKEYLDFKVENGITIKKKRRYECCYYKDKDGEFVITSTRKLGKVKKEDIHLMEEREE